MFSMPKRGHKSNEVLLECTCKIKSKTKATRKSGLSLDCIKNKTAPHTGQSSQLLVNAHDGNAQFLPNRAGAVVSHKGTRVSQGSYGTQLCKGPCAIYNAERISRLFAGCESPRRVSGAGNADSPPQRSLTP